MNNNELMIEVRKVIDKLARSEIGSYIDMSLAPPDPFRGRGKIWLSCVHEGTHQSLDFLDKVKGQSSSRFPYSSLFRLNEKKDRCLSLIRCEK
jgi:hypothetical protein